jgi:type IX secretion system PorP/SprF family membrane protein
MITCLTNTYFSGTICEKISTRLRLATSYNQKDMKKIYLISIFTIFIGFISLRGQQYPLFTNYLTNEYGYNPAVTGDVTGMQFNFLYRAQWVGIEDAPVTQLVSFRSRLNAIPLGLGGYFFKDEAGALKRTGGSLLLSYSQRLGKRSFLSGGVAGGFYNLRLRDDISVEDEMDEVIINGMGGSWFPDFNAGIQLSIGDFYLGFSVPQILERKITFGSPEIGINSLKRHYYFTTGYDIPVAENFRIEPSVLVKLTELTNPQIDASLKMTFLNAFWIGGTYRTEDAASAMAGFTIREIFDISYAYDISTSGLRNVSEGSHELSLTLRLVKTTDSDGDGVADIHDKCPAQPGPQKNNGCPQDLFTEKGAEKEDDGPDRDGDGIWDELDECPDIRGPYENKGCPWADRDFDGIRDDIDECPGLAGVASNNGCPVDDRDRDGIVDQFDKCPDQAGSFVSHGCPDRDTDKDGIVNAMDKCPNTFGPATNEGCPIVSTKELEIIQVAMRNLYFDSAKASIWRKSYPHLDRLAELMVERADWQLKIVGHTDNKGGEKSNLEVSKRRAEAVMFYLVNRGVPKKQLIVEYYGETRPFASNDKESGRQLNRRVELEFVFD